MMPMLRTAALKEQNLQNKYIHNENLLEAYRVWSNSPTMAVSLNAGNKGAQYHPSR